ncbi:flagellar basal body P-ring formation chaperone FlgA [Sedimentitalea nanhaiensis]|uniref:Flagella basal body P-ring formation protein FlgA n=1 Tax=Sedimentitalea nanhaiensis TaxID=999627 RepID=A0A1I7C822_9RHOB|nr:flagellar basal body P-ring formation chaperone FlgA [Sedimentitalea nanhaiensis]SFT95545.1 flagella basal body P-ring formation protein FlgA [Sedimentitalea nanhaiensis]
MKRLLTIALILAATTELYADILVPIRTIRAKEIIAAEDLATKESDDTGALSDARDLIGFEARVALYPGRPVRPGDVGPPAIVSRNDLISLVFIQGGLRIVTEGRSLGRGAVGETIRAMNMSSRTTISGRILSDGSIEVR